MIKNSARKRDTVTELNVVCLSEPFRMGTRVQPGSFSEHPLNRRGLQCPNNPSNRKRHVVKEEVGLCDSKTQNDF